MDNKIDKADKRASAGIASVAAMANIPSCATCFILFLAISCAFSVATWLTLTCFSKTPPPEWR